MAKKVKAKRGRTGEVRAWEPGYMDSIKYGLASLFGDDREAVRNAEKIISGAEWLPGAGDALAAAEAKDEWDAGNYGTAGVLGTLAAIGLIPGAGDAIQKGGKAAIKAIKGTPVNEAAGMMKNYEGKWEMVPIEWLEKMPGNKLRYDDLSDLKKSIQENGFTEPLIVNVGKDSGTAKLGEGNHRLAAAKELGYTHVPVRVTVGSKWGEGGKSYSDDLIPKSGEYFSADAAPSEVFKSLQQTKGVDKLQEWAAEGADDAWVDALQMPNPEKVAQESPEVQQAVGGMLKQGVTPEERGESILRLLKNRPHLVTERMFDMGDPVKNANLNAYLWDNYDLPMDEKSRQQRMWDWGGEAGPTVDMYHGTVSDIQSFDPAKLGHATGAESAGRAVWMADEPEVSDAYAKSASIMAANATEEGKHLQKTHNKAQLAEWARSDELSKAVKNGFEGDWRELAKMLEEAKRSDPEWQMLHAQKEEAWDRLMKLREEPKGNNLMPLVARGDFDYSDMDGASYAELGDFSLTEQLELAREFDKDGSVFANFSDNPDEDFLPATHLAVDKDKLHQIRSKFARFDPRLKHLRNLNAGVAPFGLMGLMGYGAMNEEDTY